MTLNTILLQQPETPKIPIALPDSVMPELTSEETIKQIENLATPGTLDKIVEALISFGFKLGIAVIVFILGKYIIKHLHSWIRKSMTRRNVDASLTTFVLSLIKITLYFILVITVVGILGIETSSFLALFASAGVAIGLALSGTLQNFAGGVLILLLKPYKVGDFIEAQGFAGTVKEIQIFNTIINTPDNKAIIIPNGGLSTSSINNYSLETRRRVDWNISVAYGTDIDTARRVILSLIAEDERVHKTPEPVVQVNELADSSINLAVRAWVSTEQYWDLYFAFNELFYKCLPQHGIQFPYPQLDVHLRKAD